MVREKSKYLNNMGWGELRDAGFEAKSDGRLRLESNRSHYRTPQRINESDLFKLSVVDRGQLIRDKNDT